MSIQVTKLDHVTVNITDVERAKAFYGGLFGLKEIPRPESFDFPGAWYEMSNAYLHLVGRPSIDPESTRHFAFWVSDIEAASAAVAAAGFPVAWDPRKIAGIDRFFTRDPDGNRVEVQGSDSKR